MNENTSNLTRRQFIAAAGSVAAASLGAGVTGCVPSEPSRAGEMPNVLFISVDDLNDWIGVLGGYEGTVHTPYMDRLANEGALFRHAHCTAPVCNPSRTSVLAGLRPSTTGVT